nr:reverse transcriptase domain-containing protein [Tanacetum cinerariifolium]
MADNRTMKEMLQAPTEGYEDAIVVPDILVENFEIRTGLLSLIQVNQFYGFKSNNPHDHIGSFNRITSTLKFRDVPNDAIKLMLFSYSLEGAAKIIGDEIYSTVDSCKTAHDMWIAIERHQHGKEIAKPITPLSESASEEDGDPKQAKRDKDMQNNLALIAKYFKKIYKPINNNLRTSLNSKNKNVDTSPRQSGSAADWDTVFQLQADTDDEIDAQELEAHYGFMEKIKEVLPPESNSTVETLEQVQYDAEYNVFANGRQHFDQPKSISNTCVVKKADSNVIPDSPYIEKKILKQVKKENASLTRELKECKSNLKESNTTRDSCLIALQCKQTKLEKYMTFNDRTVDYDKLELVKEKHDELVKQSLLAKPHYEGLVKEKTKVITDLKSKEEKDIGKIISIEKQLKFLNEIVYKMNQSIQTIYVLALKGSTSNGKPTFANPMYLKKAQSKKSCLYEILCDTSNLANIFTPDRKETLTLEKESRSKLDKDLVKPYDYTKQNSLYENFKPTSKEYHDQLAHAMKLGRKCGEKLLLKLNQIFSKTSVSYLIQNQSEKHSHDHFRAPTAHDMEILIKTCLMPLALKIQNDSFTLVHELKEEMHANLKYVESIEKEIGELESDKEEFSNMYDLLL